jgi:LacI family transcriptional regulator
VPTIKDVARKAGVSVATVSRVLNESGYFDENTARAVREAVTALAYRRNIHWARLARNSSETVCFLLGNRDAMNSMQMRLLMACESNLNQAGYDLVFASFRYSEKTVAASLDLPRLISHRGMVDGVILAGVHHSNLIDALDDLQMPHVLLGNTFVGEERHLQRDVVVYDDINGAYEAAEYLARLGHQRIVFVGNTTRPWFRRRYAGYVRAMRDSGLPELAIVADWNVSTVDYGQLAITELLRTSPRPTAIFAGNDEIAGGVWKELTRRGIRIPREMSLMGFGDRWELSLLEPSITTVSVFQDNLGTELASMLLRKLKTPGEMLASHAHPCRIVERSSCAAPPPG